MRGLFWDAFYLLALTFLGVSLMLSGYVRAEHSNLRSPADLKVLNLRTLYVDSAKYVGSVLPWIPAYSIPNYSLDLHVDLDLFDRLAFLNSMVHSMTDDTQFRLVGLQFRAGVHLHRTIDIYYEHYSQHLLDVAPSGSNVYDSVGIRLYLYRDGKQE